jgi:broad specificity phosphatase PhoE
MRTNLTYIPSGGESLLQHQERVVNAIKTACSKWKDNNVLIVSHRGTIRVFLMWLYGKEFGLYAKIPDPPGYVEVLWDEKTNRSDILHTMIT